MEEFFKICKEQKAKIKVFFEKTPSYLIAAAVAKDPKKNLIVKIICRKGIPLNGYVYDNQSDTYHYECVNYIQLGTIPISSFIKLKDNSSWKVKVPITESVLKKYLSEIQKKELKIFCSHFPSNDFDIHFIQMIYPN